jgi:hypothetical protein
MINLKGQKVMRKTSAQKSNIPDARINSDNGPNEANETSLTLAVRPFNSKEDI